MNKALKLFSIFILITSGLIGLAYYGFTQIDFIGHKSHETMKANRERRDKMLLEAKYRNGTDYCEISLLDSVNIQINAGNSSVGAIITKKYKISEDTILIIGGIKSVDKYMNSDKLVIQKHRILYLKDENGDFDTIRSIRLIFNKLKK
ncbi:MAG: hypothetical protein ACJAUD_002743 [Crocinitomicaceae bacterium]|jgi:hypothetical protein